MHAADPRCAELALAQTTGLLLDITNASRTFLQRAAVVPVGKSTVSAFLSKASTAERLTFIKEVNEVCKTFESASDTSTGATALAIFKYVADKATGPFGKYIVNEIEVGEKLIKAYADIRSSYYEIWAKTFPCALVVRPIIYQEGFIFGYNALTVEESSKKVLGLAIRTLDVYDNGIGVNPQRFLTQWGANGNSKSFSCPVDDNDAGSSITFFELYMDNYQRIFVPANAGVVDFNAGSATLYLSYNKSTGLYSVNKR